MDFITSEELRVVPEQGGPFLDMWLKLREIEHLYVPIGKADHPGDHRLNGDDAWLKLEIVTQGTDHGSMGLIFTDRRLLDNRTQYLALVTVPVLVRLFENRRVDGLIFNDPAGQGTNGSNQPHFSTHEGFSCIVPRVTLARLIGMLMSPDPSATTNEHRQLAQQALAVDQPYVALHHARLLRESGTVPEEFFYEELAALIALQLGNEAMRLFKWYHREGGNGSRFELFHARLLTTFGRPEEAIPLAEASASNVELAGLAHLELGRALRTMGECHGAVRQLGLALSFDRESIDAHLNYGMALHDKHRDANDIDGLHEAAEWLRKVVQRGGFQAAEALKHLVTIFVVAGRPDRAEAAARACLVLRDSATVRRHLVLSLLAQHRAQEARREARVLKTFHPREAQLLAQHGL